MSAVLVIQQNNQLFIGSDSAISTTLNNVQYRLSNEGKKLYQIDDRVFFVSGNMNLSYIIVKAYKNSLNKSIEKLRDIAKLQYGLYIHKKSQEQICDSLNLDILVGTYENEQSVIYQISPYNNFEIIKRTVDKGNIAIWTGGIKTKECFNVAYENILKKYSIQQIFQNTFNSISYECIGGWLEVYSITKEKQLLIYRNKISEKKINWLTEDMIKSR